MEQVVDAPESGTVEEFRAKQDESLRILLIEDILQ